jgi:hypothetical protein
MSLQSAADFTIAATHNEVLAAKILETARENGPEQIGSAMSALGKSEGYDFTPAEAEALRQSAIANGSLSEDDLNKVAGGSVDSDYLAAQARAAANALGGRAAAGSGGVFGGAADGAAQAAANGGSANDVVAGAAVGAAKGLNETKSTVQQIFSGW